MNPLGTGPTLAVISAIWLSLAVMASSGLAVGQNLDCRSCARQSDCGLKRDACISECRARIFSIDPRRTGCINTCDDAATACMHSVENYCQSGRRCQ